MQEHQPKTVGEDDKTQAERVVSFPVAAKGVVSFGLEPPPLFVGFIRGATRDRLFERGLVAAASIRVACSVEVGRILGDESGRR